MVAQHPEQLTPTKREWEPDAACSGVTQDEVKIVLRFSKVNTTGLCLTTAPIQNILNRNMFVLCVERSNITVPV